MGLSPSPVGSVAPPEGGQDGNAWLDTHVVLENGRINMGKTCLVSEVGSLLGLPCMSSG